MSYKTDLQANNIDLQGILDTVNALPDAGSELPELTTPAAAGQILSGYETIDADGNKLIGTMPTVEQATPGITVSSSGLITASATQGFGYTAGGTKSATQQLSVQAAKTVTPGTSAKTAVASGKYTTGAVTVAGDANLVAANIVSGKSIFGVAGSAVTKGALKTAGIMWNQLSAVTRGYTLGTATGSQKGLKIELPSDVSIDKVFAIKFDSTYCRAPNGKSTSILSVLDHTYDGKVQFSGKLPIPDNLVQTASFIDGRETTASDMTLEYVGDNCLVLTLPTLSEVQTYQIMFSDGSYLKYPTSEGDTLVVGTLYYFE